MQIFGKFSVTTDDQGAGEISIQIPGVFSGVDSADSKFSGRSVVWGEFEFANPLPGDQVISFTIQDTNGVIPEPMRAAFPAYPILGSWFDKGLKVEHQGLYIIGEKTELVPPKGKSKIASGLFIVMAVQKASAVSDTLYGNILWDDFT